MSTRRARGLLWMTACGLLGATLAAVLAHVFVPVSIQQGAGAADSGTASALDQTQVSQYGAIDHASLQAIAGRDFRQRLFDAPIVEPEPPPPKPMPPVELLSTVLPARGAPYAWVSDGQVARRVSANDVLGPSDNPVVVIAIESNRVLVNHEGREVELLQRGAEGAER